MSHLTSSKSTAFPLELFELFICEIWQMPLSNEDRAAFILSSSLVSQAWKEMIYRNSLTDVHITSFSYGKKLIRILEGREPDKYEQERSWVKAITLTLEYDPAAREPGTRYTSPPMIITASSLLRIFDRGGRARFPNLRRLNIGHLNPPFDADIFDLFIWNPFPSIISELALTYDHSPNTPPELITRREAHYGRWQKSLRKRFNSVKVLNFRGAPRELITDFEAVCPKVQTITMEFPETGWSGVRYCYFDMKALKGTSDGANARERRGKGGYWTAVREEPDCLRVYPGDPP